MYEDFDGFKYKIQEMQAHTNGVNTKLKRMLETASDSFLLLLADNAIEDCLLGSVVNSKLEEALSIVNEELKGK